MTYRSIRERTFLHDLTAAGTETVMVNVPLTGPPPEVSGKLVAGGVLPKGRPFTYPESLAADLARAGTPFPINGMSWTTFRHRPEPFLDEAREATLARQRATQQLLDTTDWRVAVAVFVATDRIQHCMSEYLSPDHPAYAERSKDALAAKVVDVYRLLDEGLGALVDRTGPDDLVLFMSDHGMQSCTGTVNMDRLLAELGFLEFSASNAIFGPMQWGPVRSAARKVYDLLGLHGKVSLPQSVNWAKTRAYTGIRSTGEGVNVNLAGRESDGVVAAGDFDRVRDELAERLAAFVDPRTGQHPVARVLRREEVFKGRYAQDAARPPARAGAAVFAHPRATRGRSRGLDLGRPSDGGGARRRGSKRGPGGVPRHREPGGPGAHHPRRVRHSVVGPALGPGAHRGRRRGRGGRRRRPRAPGGSVDDRRGPRRGRGGGGGGAPPRPWLPRMTIA